MSPRVVVALVAAVVLGSCGGLSFRDDRSFTVTAPEEDATVGVPFTVSWTLEPEDGSPARFGVYVDQQPVRPGKRIELKANDHGIHVVDSRSIEISEVLRRSDGPSSERDTHDVTVVMLDADNRRIGELSAHRQVEVRR